MALPIVLALQQGPGPIWQCVPWHCGRNWRLPPHGMGLLPHVSWWPTGQHSFVRVHEEVDVFVALVRPPESSEYVLDGQIVPDMACPLCPGSVENTGNSASRASGPIATTLLRWFSLPTNVGCIWCGESHSSQVHHTHSFLVLCLYSCHHTMILLQSTMLSSTVGTAFDDRH